MKVLVTNDDGVKAEGIKLLVEKLVPYCEEITVVAPLVEMSANSHRLNIKDGIKLEQLEDIYPGVKTYGISGTPADCVLFAMYALNIQFDTVFSGVNRGYNLGDDIVYSGTVAAAEEALMKGKRAIAVSCRYNTFEGLIHFDDVMEYILKHPLWNMNTIININIPVNAKGIKITHQAKSSYKSFFTQKEDGLYYSGVDVSIPHYDDPNGDLQTIDNGYISITPLTFNRTDYETLKKVIK